MMMLHGVADWTDAYTNAAHIVGGDVWPERWTRDAAAWRAGLGARARLDIPYGEGERNRYDLFMPEGPPKGLVVYVHGGYWMRFDRSFWSHLARGPVAHGFAVAMPSYSLCPAVRISDITAEVGKAVAAAAEQIGGPIHLTGHSAGGHLAARMVCTDSPLPEAVLARIGNVVSISGVHDLRPLLRTSMNETLKLDQAEAEAESPALLHPLEGIGVTCWVGKAERAEFVRQNGLLANIWTGLGARTAAVEEPDRHHFDVVDGLGDPAHALTRTLLTA